MRPLAAVSLILTLAMAALAASPPAIAGASFPGADFVDRVKRAGHLAGASSWALAENTALGSGFLATPRSIVNRWMHSPVTEATS